MKIENQNIVKAMDMLESEIIKYIQSKGGSALQSQIQHDLGFGEINCNPDGKPTRGWFCGALLRSLYDKGKLKRELLSARAISWTLIE